MRARAILAGVFGLFAALAVHAGILLFGGWFFLKEEGAAASAIPVELLDTLEDRKKEEDRTETPEEPDEVRRDEDAPPDTSAIAERLDETPIADASPRLDAATIAELTNAMNGAGAGGEFFTGATSFESGIIGGARRGDAAGDDPIEDAFDPAGIDQAARVIVQTAPAYPGEMRGKRVEGLVTLIFVVDASGKVESPKVESSSHKAFESPALAAVRKWKFEPGIRGGERVASKKRITIRFPAA